MSSIAIPRAPIGERLHDVSHPIGWYCVGDSEAITQDAMLPLRWLGKQLIAYRTPSGAARIIDAYCPHLGAHLASHDGCIRNGRVVCPFHKWEFDTETGRAVAIPYAKVIPVVALAGYRTREVNGMVMMWYHPNGDAPTFPPFDDDEFGGRRFVRYLHRRWSTTGPYRDNLENLFDTAHIRTLHRATDMPKVAAIDERDYGLKITYKPDENEASLDRFEFHFGGLTHMVQRYFGRGWEVINVLYFTPVDIESWVLDASIYVLDTGSSEGIETLGRAFGDRFVYEVEQDLPIFDHKKHLQKPRLCAGDGPIMQYREYCKKFFL